MSHQVLLQSKKTFNRPGVAVEDWAERRIGNRQVIRIKGRPLFMLDGLMMIGGGHSRICL